MKKIILILLISLSVSALNAFDGSREGFLVSAGIGASSQEITYNNHSEPNNYDNVALNLKVGYGFNENFTMYAIRQSNWLDVNLPNSSSVNAINGITGVGGTYFFSRGDSFFISGVVGVSDFSVDNSSYGSNYGTGGLISIGYELGNGFSMEGVLKMSTKIEDDYNGQKIELDSTGTQFFLVYTWY